MLRFSGHKGKLNSNTKNDKISTKWKAKCSPNAVWWRIFGLKNGVGILFPVPTHSIRGKRVGLNSAKSLRDAKPKSPVSYHHRIATHIIIY